MREKGSREEGIKGEGKKGVRERERDKERLWVYCRDKRERFPHLLTLGQLDGEVRLSGGQKVTQMTILFLHPKR